MKHYIKWFIKCAEAESRIGNTHAHFPPSSLPPPPFSPTTNPFPISPLNPFRYDDEGQRGRSDDGDSGGKTSRSSLNGLMDLSEGDEIGLLQGPAAAAAEDERGGGGLVRPLSLFIYMPLIIWFIKVSWCNTFFLIIMFLL